MTYESSDYGLWDTKWSKIFFKEEDAKEYSELYYQMHGWGLDICEFEVE